MLSDDRPWPEDIIAYIRRLEAQVAELRQHNLTPLEQGARIIDGGVDVTEREKARLRQSIAGIEAIIAEMCEQAAQRMPGAAGARPI